MYYSKSNIPKDIKKLTKNLTKLGQLHEYFFKFNYNEQFTLEDMKFENVSKDIYNKFKHLKKFLVVAINHACPMALHFCDTYPKQVLGIICYPFRFYCKESYTRRIWKFKNNKGWNHEKYDINKYLLKTNEKRFGELFNNITDEKKEIIYLNFDFGLQKQYYKIPQVFKVPTILFTRLDLDTKSIIKYNYERKEIAKMKQIITKDDALYNSMIWNFDRVKYDSQLIKKNENNNFLNIKYLVSGHETYDDVVDEVILFIEKNE
jgi:hypothetical protein